MHATDVQIVYRSYIPITSKTTIPTPQVFRWTFKEFSIRTKSKATQGCYPITTKVIINLLLLLITSRSLRWTSQLIQNSFKLKPFQVEEEDTSNGLPCASSLLSMMMDLGNTQLHSATAVQEELLLNIRSILFRLQRSRSKNTTLSWLHPEQEVTIEYYFSLLIYHSYYYFMTYLKKTYLC